MSKASEWLNSGGRPKDRLLFVGAALSAHVIRRSIKARPQNTVRLSLMRDGYRLTEITPQTALAFARWILATFSDEPSS